MRNTVWMPASLATLAIVTVGRLAGAVETPAKGGGDARVNGAIARQFGASVQPLWDRKPYYLTGDFNGDSLQDDLVLVRTSTSIASGVTLLNPWHPRAARAPGGGGTALAILHGSRRGRDTPTARFLVTDREFFASPIWQAPAGSALISVKKKPLRGASTPKGARGDLIHLATEAGIDVTLYWDGETYRVFAPQEEP